MKKNYVLWFALWAFFLIGCRNDNFSSSEAANNQQALKFRVVSESEIPQVIRALQTKTDHFKVRINNHSSANGKTETVFGEINTNYILKLPREQMRFTTHSLWNLLMGIVLLTHIT